MAACYVVFILMGHHGNLELRRQVLRDIDDSGGYVLFVDEYSGTYGVDLSQNPTHNGERTVHSVIFNGDKCSKTLAVNLHVIHEIRMLKVGGKSIDDECVLGFSQLPSLEILTIHNSSVSDKGAIALGKLQRIRELRLSRSNITDSGLAALCKSKTLEVLNVSNTRASDACIAHIEGASALKSLNVDNTLITSAAIGALRSMRPDLTISHN